MVLAVVILRLGACLALGLWPGRKSSLTATGYVAGDRTLGLVLMYFITGATIFSAFAFLGAPGWAYSRGAAVFYILGYGAIGFIPFYFVGPRASRLGRAYGFVTQAEMVAARFGRPAIAGVMALISTAAFVPYLALQMKGAGYVLFEVTGGALPTWLGAALVYTVVLIYVLKSGVLGVGWTNTFQGIFMMTLAWGLGLYLPSLLHGGVSEMFSNIAATRPELLASPGLNKAGDAPWAWGEYSSAVLVSAAGFCFWPHLFMKAFTAKDELTIRRTVVLYPTFQIFLVPLFLIGFAAVGFEPPPVRPDQVLPHLLMQLPQVPSLLVGLFCAGALAASMSSGDAMAHAAASILVRDGYVRALGHDLPPATERQAVRLTLVAVLVAAYLMAVVYQGSLVMLLLSAFGAVVQFMPAVVATLYSRRVRGGAVLSGLLLGGVVTVAMILYPALRPAPLHPGLFGLAANLAVVAGAALFRPATLSPEEARYMDAAGGNSGAGRAL